MLKKHRLVICTMTILVASALLFERDRRWPNAQLLPGR